MFHDKNRLGFPKAFVDFVLTHLLFIAFLPSSSSFQPYCHYSIRYDYSPSCGWSHIPKLPLHSCPTSFTPSPSITPWSHVLSLSGASLLDKYTERKKCSEPRELARTLPLSHTVELGVASAGPWAISNGVALLPEGQLVEGIRNLSSGFAMDLRGGSTPKASPCLTFRALSVSRNRYPLTAWRLLSWLQAIHKFLHYCMTLDIRGVENYSFAGQQISGP